MLQTSLTFPRDPALLLDLCPGSFIPVSIPCAGQRLEPSQQQDAVMGGPLQHCCAYEKKCCFLWEVAGLSQGLGLPSGVGGGAQSPFFLLGGAP